MPPLFDSSETPSLPALTIVVVWIVPALNIAPPKAAEFDVNLVPASFTSPSLYIPPSFSVALLFAKLELISV